MFVSYSASKRQKQPYYPPIQADLYTPRAQASTQRHQQFQDRLSKYSATKRNSSYRKQPQYQYNKENHNRMQYCQQPFQNKFSYSPIKQPYVPYDLSKSRRNANDRMRKQIQAQQMQQIYTNPKVYQGRESARSRNQFKQKPANYYIEKNTNPIEPQFNYKNQYPQNKAFNYEKEPIKTHRQPLKNFQSMEMTFSNKSKNLIPDSRTPPKIIKQNQHLVQKSELLKQKIQRLNRMTPRGNRNQITHSQSVTPEKLSVELFPKQSYQTTIIRHNKYCDEKLPLQTIYDAQQRRLQAHNFHQSQFEAEAGIIKINKLSQKISQRLSAIIKKHIK